MFFALSAHTDELGGNISEALKETIEANDANITVLTELLPDAVSKLLHSNAFDESAIPTTTLALDAAAGTIQRKACDGFRGKIGMLRGAWGRWYRAGGFISYAHVAKNVAELSSAPESSLLHEHLDDLLIHHDDTFILEMRDMDVGSYTASQLLERVLEGFLLNAPKAVSHMMSVRNILVTPLGLRTSPLGCPVSSLLSDDTSNLFADKYPVLDKRIADSGKEAQVILGANDKHLIFRSCVGVEIKDTRHVNITLGSRVHCKNWFGIFYMRMIDLVHRRYISPTMLRRSVDYMASQLKR